MNSGDSVRDGWEHFHHGADIGIRGIGMTCPAAFEKAALAMTAVIADPATISPTVKVSLDCEAPDNELLLVDWLNALVYEMASRRMLFSRFNVRIADHRLHGAAWGEPIDRARHQPAVEIKGATYTALGVHQDSHGLWSAQCVVDV